MMFKEMKEKKQQLYITMFLYRKKKKKTETFFWARGLSIIRKFSLFGGVEGYWNPTSAKSDDRL
jgi:hypothetical protein